MDNEQEYGLMEVKSDDAPVTRIPTRDLVELAEQGEKFVTALNKIKQVALMATNPNDWVDENGKPYLQASGAEKVGRVFGVSWRINEPTFDNLDGGHYMYSYTGEFCLKGECITAVGTRSSKDGFFKKYRWDNEHKDKDGKAQRIELPPSEIDRGDVKKSAFTNLLANGITRLLGLRNLTWDDLEKFANITQAKVQSIQFKKEGKAQTQTKTQTKAQPQATPRVSAPQPQPVEQEAPPPAEQGTMMGDASTAQVNAINTMMDKLEVGDLLAKNTMVRDILGLAYTPASVENLSKQQASDVIKSLSEALKK